MVNIQEITTGAVALVALVAPVTATAAVAIIAMGTAAITAAAQTAKMVAQIQLEHFQKTPWIPGSPSKFSVYF